MRGLEIDRLGRRFPTVVIAAVLIGDRDGDQFLGRHVIEARDRDRNEITTQDVEVAIAEAADSAMPAEAMVPYLRAELILGDRLLAGDDAECVGLGPHAPAARLGAVGAVAAAGAGGEVDLAFEAQRAAVTAAGVRLETHGWFTPSYEDNDRTLRHADVSACQQTRSCGDARSPLPESVSRGWKGVAVSNPRSPIHVPPQFHPRLREERAGERRPLRQGARRRAGRILAELRDVRLPQRHEARPLGQERRAAARDAGRRRRTRLPGRE